MSEDKLTRSEPTSLAPRTMKEVIKFAEMVANSGFAPAVFKGKPNDVVIAIQMGMEIGLLPMQALQAIAVINGRPSLWGDAALALVRSHPDCMDVIEVYDASTQTAVCTVKRRGCEPCVRQFTVADAKTAKLWGKQGPWTQYPARMLQQRARGFALRDSFPDALRGIITREEAHDIPPDDVIDAAESLGEPTIIDSEPAAPTDEPTEEQLATVAACNSKDELRNIYRGTESAALKAACKQRVSELEEQARLQSTREPGEDG